PDKTPARRLATLHAAGRAAVPFTTGILVGIGETRVERLEALAAIREAHERYGHVQEVIIQNFLPKPGTAMARAPACDPEEFLWSVAAARLVLGGEMHLQAPPNLSDDLGPLVAAGIDDWGGVSPVTPDHVNPERPWPALEGLRAEAVGDVVTFVRNRNINYTNICTFRCRFCAFSKGPLSLNLRGTPYLLDLEEIQRRVVEAVECGATEVCLQGGIHPDFDGSYYVDVARAVKAVAPGIHVHGFTALEVTEGARRLGVPLADYLREPKNAGPATPPGA